MIEYSTSQSKNSTVKIFQIQTEPNTRHLNQSRSLTLHSVALAPQEVEARQWLVLGLGLTVAPPLATQHAARAGRQHHQRAHHHAHGRHPRARVELLRARKEVLVQLCNIAQNFIEIFVLCRVLHFIFL